MIPLQDNVLFVSNEHAAIFLNAGGRLNKGKKRSGRFFFASTVKLFLSEKGTGNKKEKKKVIA